MKRTVLSSVSIVALTTASFANCSTSSGPIVVSSDNQQIHDLHISNCGSNPCIDTNGHTGVSIYTVKIDHNGGVGIYSNGGSGTQINAVNINGNGATPGANIYCYNSDITVDNVLVQNGGGGIVGNTCGMTLTHIQGYNIKGGTDANHKSFVQYISSYGSIKYFSLFNPSSNLNKGDGVNIYQSDNIEVAYGDMDGNYNTYGSHIQCDDGSNNCYVHDIYVRHYLDSAFAAFGRGGDIAGFYNVFASDNVCVNAHGDKSLAGKSISFLGSCTGTPYCKVGGVDDPKTHVTYGSTGAPATWNHPSTCTSCTSPDPTYGCNVPTQGGINSSNVVHASFTPPTAFVASVCP